MSQIFQKSGGSSNKQRVPRFLPSILRVLLLNYTKSFAGIGTNQEKIEYPLPVRASPSVFRSV